MKETIENFVRDINILNSRNLDEFEFEKNLNHLIEKFEEICYNIGNKESST